MRGTALAVPRYMTLREWIVILSTHYSYFLPTIEFLIQHDG